MWPSLCLARRLLEQPRGVTSRSCCTDLRARTSTACSLLGRGAPPPQARGQVPGPAAGGDSSWAVLTGAGGAGRVSQPRARGVPGAARAWS